MTRPAPTPLADSPRSVPPAKDVVVSVAATGLERDRFIRFQEEIYRGDPNFVPPLLMERHEFLDPGKNPFFLHADVTLFLATREGKPVGRIAAIEDRNYNAFQGTKVAAFGLFECVDDPGVAAALVAAVKNWARWRGLTSIVGPMSFSSNHEIGLLVEGFDEPPFVMMPYNPRYYEDLLLACGLRKAKDLWSYWRSARTAPPERFLRVADKIKSHAGITVRSLDMRNFEGEVARIKGIYNSAWEKNWGFVPMTDAEFDKLARDLKPIIRPELCLMAEDQGEPVAFSLTVPDVNQALRHVGGRLTTFGLPLGLAKLLWYQRRVTKVRLLALGIKEGWRRRGLDAVLIVDTIRLTGEHGYEGGEVGWTLEDNDLINKAIEGVGGQRSRVYRVFEAPVE